MMHNLDFTRDFLLRSRDANISSEVAKFVRHLTSAELFILPVGGILIEDSKLKAIDEKIRLTLPYPIVALEWVGNNHNKKNILLLRELEDDIELTPLMYDGRTSKWGWQPSIFIDRVKYIEREESGKVAYFMRYECAKQMEFGLATKVYHPYLHTFLAFINVLSCKNIKTERSVPGAVRLARRSPIPYSEYKILTIGATNYNTNRIGGGGSQEGRIHSRARSHLRMGHIVRGKTGAYWRNAHTVCADSEFSITKVYKVKGQTV